MALTCLTPIRESLVPAAITPRLLFVSTVRELGSSLRKPEWAHRGSIWNMAEYHPSQELQGRSGGFRLPVMGRPQRQVPRCSSMDKGSQPTQSSSTSVWPLASCGPLRSSLCEISRKRTSSGSAGTGLPSSHFRLQPTASTSFLRSGDVHRYEMRSFRPVL